ncbi:tRNA (adenosine(37)-N6)-threonylcarbamoyltransferase complex dimerization subunit type 1 TsaB [Anaplasma ovis str. Haibei]|uniref:tRNA (Adenosine(37)-N6)-threonylcarbamoyltransferase complex dimerization subunit type 1 TsaB n=2 Tax=Anaplasma ovis TaxID=142058 RepID=A0A2Z2L7V9_9RICK|nr:tRNA (adenosine(37)-N6)-threonylcarbamoyltransferase complex dimerization subunit type 1 TsaB [Anaplasma ovis str. Haibei]
MKVMALDASGAQCAVAVFDVNRQKFSEAVSPMHNRHAEFLLSLIDSALADSGFTYLDLTHTVATVGPGSFTGLRASLAALQGFRLVSNIPIHAVTLLELQAYLISKHGSIDGNILSIVDLPNDSRAYSQVFNSKLLPITDATITERSLISEDGYTTLRCCNIPDSTNARIAAEFLVYKLSHKLPETPLTPIYSRSYT